MVVTSVSAATLQELYDAFTDAGGATPAEAAAIGIISSFRSSLKRCKPSGEREAQKLEFAQVLRQLRSACEDTCVNHGLGAEQ